MGEPLIAIPTESELPPEFRLEASRPVVKPRLPKVNAKDIPTPIGWRIIVLPVSIPTKTEGGIDLVGDTLRHMNMSKRIGVVMAIGDLAFSERRGFPEGYQPIEVGDWVQFHEHSGVDTLMEGEEGLVSIKYLVERDILGKPSNPDRFMVMI